MAMAEMTRTNAVLEGFGNLTVVRQIGIMIGLAASVAIGVGVVFWAQEPSFRPLYTDISHLDASQVVDVLQQEDILYKVDTNTGMLLVASERIHDARLSLAAAGFPTGGTLGYELLDKQQAFGTSQFMEKARYHRSLEGELSKTIANLTHVRAARVHLAIPKPAVFLNDRRKPSASVMLELYAGRSLDPSQVAAIVHMVSSSIPEMSLDGVTVLDQKGNLLSDPGGNESLAVAAKQLDYTQKVEDKYLSRIVKIIEPIVGTEKYRAQVSADIDFTMVEQAAERYNPDLRSLRSEQNLTENLGLGGSVPTGVPGALANQPPQDGQIPETAEAAPPPGREGETPAKSTNQRQQVARNYEIDRTVSHTKHQVGVIKRLSVAVVVDDRSVVQGEGAEKEVVQQPMTPEEMARITRLIKDAVGFDVTRGDTVNVINQPFLKHIDTAAEIPEPAIWEQPWVWDIGKQISGLLGIVVLLLFVLRPILRSLAHVSETDSVHELPDEMELAPEPELEEITLTGGPESLLPGPDQSYDSQLNAIKGMVADDPRRVAQVVKSWLHAGA